MVEFLVSEQSVELLPERQLFLGHGGVSLPVITECARIDDADLRAEWRTSNIRGHSILREKRPSETQQTQLLARRTDWQSTQPAEKMNLQKSEPDRLQHRDPPLTLQCRKTG